MDGPPSISSCLLVVLVWKVSAKNGHGVSDAFYTLAVDIVQSLEAAQRRGSDDRRGSRSVSMIHTYQYMLGLASH